MGFDMKKTERMIKFQLTEGETEFIIHCCKVELSKSMLSKSDLPKEQLSGIQVLNDYVEGKMNTVKREGFQ